MDHSLSFMTPQALRTFSCCNGHAGGVKPVHREETTFYDASYSMIVALFAPEKGSEERVL